MKNQGMMTIIAPRCYDIPLRIKNNKCDAGLPEWGHQGTTGMGPIGNTKSCLRWGGGGKTTVMNMNIFQYASKKEVDKTPGAE